MTVVLQVLMVAALLFGLGCVVGDLLSRRAPRPFDRCDVPDCPHQDEEVG